MDRPNKNFQNLPFDMLIGNPTLYKWKTELSWHGKTMTITPKTNSSEKLNNMEIIQRSTLAKTNFVDK
jgi:hypothetical protein